MFRGKCRVCQECVGASHVISDGGYNCLATVRVTSGGNVPDTAVQLPALRIVLFSASFILIPVTYSIRMRQAFFTFVSPFPKTQSMYDEPKNKLMKRSDRLDIFLTFIY